MATILQILMADRHFNLFSRGLKIASLEEKLSEIGPFTILAPVNLAISRLDSPAYEKMLEPAHRSELSAFLAGHILVGKKMISDLRNNQQLEMLNGSAVTVSVRDGLTSINDVKVLSGDRQGSNGVIHVLDKAIVKTH